jgi:hypothetical protein
MTASKIQYRLLCALLVFSLSFGGLMTFSVAIVSAAPTSVTIAGDMQSEAGCAGDWDPACAATHLTYDATDDIWQGIFTLPAGSYNYLAALNDSWAVNYGAHAQLGGPNIGLTLGATSTPVKFYYDDKSHWVTDNANSVIATFVGDFQNELGCPGDWQPDCLRSWLQDPDGNGIYHFQTTNLPVGSYSGKVALNENWSENYGAGGVLGGANIAFSVTVAGSSVGFTYNAVTHVPEVDVTAPTVTSITRLNPSPTYLASVHFTVTFSEAVTGVDVTDFSLTTTGITGASVTGVSGSGSVYNVTVSTGSGSGTLRLNVVDNDSIVDLALNPLGGAGAGNGNFNSGATYVVRVYWTYLPIALRQ